MGPQHEPVTVPHPTPLQEAVEANLHGHLAYLQRRLPGMAVLDTADLLLIDSGLPSDTFNQLARARLDATTAGHRIAQAVAHFRAAGRPFSWWVGPGSRPLDLQGRLVAHGLRHAETETAMALDLSHLAVPPSGREEPPGLAVRPVTGAGELTDFAAVLAANWTPPDPAVGRFYGAATAELLRPGCPMRLYVGYLGGAPVGACEVFDHEGVAGLYAVVTLAPFRRRGIAGAVIRAALDEARRRGLATATLQASAAGRGVYARLGFRECGRFAEYQ